MHLEYFSSKISFQESIITERYKPFKYILLCLGVSGGLKLCLFNESIWLTIGELYGAAREAFRTEEIFPLEMTYTVQKSGAPFDTLLGILDVLNLREKIIEY